MVFPPRPTRAEIDLSALRHNLRQVRNCCAAGQGVLAVVKADAYGHGAVVVSRALEDVAVEQFAVATLEEGIELRAAGIARPILVLGGCYAGQEAEFMRQGLTAAVFSLPDLQRLQHFGMEDGIDFPVHLKCDTGMGRVGFLPAEIPRLIKLLREGTGVEAVGLMSHLACADETGSVETGRQIEVFRKILGQLAAAGIQPPHIHLSNSAGLTAWELPEATLVRPGIILYGGYPSREFESQLDLRPVMTFSTRIAQLRMIEAGQGVSYGHTYRTQRQTRLATLPVGYADGYNRLFSNCGEVLIRGERAPVVGRVCMDWILVDVTDIENATVGDRVVLLGADDEECISAEEWAEKLDTINYEVFCRIAPRVPRYFV
jgi:alanine racemase